jgi:hypothetical protein
LAYVNLQSLLFAASPHDGIDAGADFGAGDEAAEIGLAACDLIVPLDDNVAGTQSSGFGGRARCDVSDEYT